MQASIGGSECRSDQGRRKRDATATEAARHALPGQHRRDPVGERAGAAAEGGRRAARRLRAREAAPRGRLVARPARRRCRAGSRQQFAAFARLAPTTDVFHFYFGLTLRPEVDPVPAPARAAQEERLPLPRLRHPRQVAATSSRSASAPTPRSSAATTRSAGCPRRTSIPPGLDLRPFTPVPPSDEPRPLVVHAPSNREKKGTAHVIEACAQLHVELDIVEGVPHEEARDALRDGRHRRRPAQRRLARRLRARVDGARQAGRHPPEAGRRRAERRRASASASRSCPRRRRRSSTRCARSSSSRRCGARSAPRAAPTSSRCTTSTGSPTAWSTSTVRC